MLTGTVQGGGIFERHKVPEIVQDTIILPGRKFRTGVFLFLVVLPPLAVSIGGLTVHKGLSQDLLRLGIFVLLVWTLGYYVFKRRVPKFSIYLLLKHGNVSRRK